MRGDARTVGGASYDTITMLGNTITVVTYSLVDLVGAGGPFGSWRIFADRARPSPLLVNRVGLMAEVARANSKRRLTVLRDLTPEAFREHVRKSNDPARP
jgi:hypothetical protein